MVVAMKRTKNGAKARTKSGKRAGRGQENVRRNGKVGGIRRETGAVTEILPGKGMKRGAKTKKKSGKETGAVTETLRGKGMVGQLGATGREGAEGTAKGVLMATGTGTAMRMILARAAPVAAAARRRQGAENRSSGVSSCASARWRARAQIPFRSK